MTCSGETTSYLRPDDVMQICAIACATLVLIFLYCRLYRTGTKQCVTVVVFGDLARSPRMQYHTASLAAHGLKVDVIGIDAGLPLYSGLLNNPDITVRNVRPAPQLPQIFQSRKLFLFSALWRYSFLVTQIAAKLAFVVPRPHAVLLQNPPAFPTLPIVWTCSWLRGYNTIIDVHNFGYSLLEAGGRPKALVRAYLSIEAAFIASNPYVMTVSDAMSNILRNSPWVPPRVHRPIFVVRDCAPAIFQPTVDVGAVTAVLEVASQCLQPVSGGLSQAYASDPSSHKLFGHCIGASGQRSAVLISATSWTVDEDFTPVLEAASVLDEQLSHSNCTMPTRLLIVISGKGAGEAPFRMAASSLGLRNITIATGYFPTLTQYAGFLGLCDVGISVHASSSGLDLPMKVVDMQGAGLPVAALDYPALPELVQDGVNGLVFTDGPSLATALRRLLTDWPTAPMLQKFRAVVRSRREHWNDHWNTAAKPLIDLALHGAKISASS